MFKCFSHFFACLLLVLIPLQGIAAANMLVCNSMMQLASENKASAMPCHKHMVSMASEAKSTPTNHAMPCKTACKTVCATLCASLSAMTAIPSNINPASLLAATQSLALADQTYASITLPSLQRPPILLS